MEALYPPGRRTPRKAGPAPPADYRPGQAHRDPGAVRPLAPGRWRTPVESRPPRRIFRLPGKSYDRTLTRTKTMKISQMLAARKPLFSFEFFPPKDDAATEALMDVVRQLRDLRPD